MKSLRGKRVPTVGWGRAIVLCAALAPWTVAICDAAPGASDPPDGPPRLTLEELRARYRSAADRVLTIEGIDVYYRDEGAGPAILLIHGSNSTMRSFDRLARDLGRRHRVIRYDVPPNGLSGSIPDDVVGRIRPSDVPARLLGSLGITSATVVGVSSGGTTALFLAAEHPDLVAHVIVSCAPVGPVDLTKLKRSPDLEAAERTYGAYADRSRTKPVSFWRTYADFYSAVPGRIPERSVEEMYDFARRSVERNGTALTGVVADQPRAIAARRAVTAPVLLLWGGSDRLLPPAVARALADDLVNASVSTVIVPDAGHYPPTEIPERYAAIVETYLTQVAPADTGKARSVR